MRNRRARVGANDRPRSVLSQQAPQENLLWDSADAHARAGYEAGARRVGANGKKDVVGASPNLKQL